MPCLPLFSGATWFLWLVRGVCLLGIVTVVALLLRSHRTVRETAVDAPGILQERLARGEISVEEFESKKALLSR